MGLNRIGLSDSDWSEHLRHLGGIHDDRLSTVAALRFVRDKSLDRWAHFLFSTTTGLVDFVDSKPPGPYGASIT